VSVVGRAKGRGGEGGHGKYVGSVVEGGIGHSSSEGEVGRGKKNMTHRWAPAPEARASRTELGATGIKGDATGMGGGMGRGGRRGGGGSSAGGTGVRGKGEGRRGGEEDCTPRTRLRNMMDRARAALAEPF